MAKDVPKTFMKILFITSNRIGDAVLTTGLLAWMVDHHPTAHFTIACGPYGADLFRAVPRLDRLIIMKKKRANGHWFDLWKECFPIKWDLIVDLRNSIVSRLLRADKKAFHHKGRGEHKVVANAAVLHLSPPPHPHIWVSAGAEDEATLILKGHSKILALGPAANWPPKQWPIENFVDLVERLCKIGGALENASVLIVADEHERSQIRPLLDAIPDRRRIEVIGRSLQLAAACLKRANLYVGNDSGLMHLSAALGVRTLGMFGPGYPDIYGPWGDRCAYVTTPETRDELLKRLPDISARSPNLMGGLKPGTVQNEAEALLRRP